MKWTYLFIKGYVFIYRFLIAENHGRRKLQNQWISIKSTKLINSIILQFKAGDDQVRKKRTFRKFTYRGVDLDQLLDMPNEQLCELMHSRARRRFSRGLKRKPMALIAKLRKAKKEAPPLEKPAIVKTHLRDMIIVPEMVGSIVGIYNGKTFNQVSFLFLFNTP